MGTKKPDLRKVISWPQGAALTVGAILGSGILVLPHTAAALAGPASLISWLLMGLLAVPLAAVLGALGMRYPDAGGIASYAQRAFGERASVVTGWLFLGTVPIGAPIVALIGATYVATLFSLSHPAVVALAAAMLSLALFFNYRGMKLSGTVQTAVIAVIVLLLVGAIVAALPHVRAAAFRPFFPKGWIPVGVAMTRLFWAFVGWEIIVNLTEEFRRPEHDLPLSLGIALVVINVMYLSLAFVTIGTRSYRSASGVALAALMQQGWGPWAGIVTGVLAFVVCYATIHTYIAGFSRLVYAQARQGYFPRYFAALHDRFQVPHRVFLVLAPVFLCVLLIYLWRGLDLGVLIQWPSAIFIALYIIGMAAAAKLLRDSAVLCSLAVIALVMCVAVYGFLGWVGLYPFGLGALGLSVHAFRQHSGSRNRAA